MQMAAVIASSVQDENVRHAGDAGTYVDTECFMVVPT
jgi:hypothetical protein